MLLVITFSNTLTLNLNSRISATLCAYAQLYSPSVSCIAKAVLFTFGEIYSLREFEGEW